MKTPKNYFKLLGLSAAASCLQLFATPSAEAQSILYICGDQKGNAGISFDHGLMTYIGSKYSGASLTATLSDETTGTSPQGLYDPSNPTATESYDFNTFDCVILSSTVSTHYVPQLMDDLNLTTTNLLVMSEESLVDLRMVDNDVSFLQTDTVFDGTASVAITNYPGNAILSYGDNYWPEADTTAWKDSANETAGTGGFLFSYDQGETVDPGTPFTMAGNRTFFGLSEGEVIPSPETSGVWTDDGIDNDIVDIDGSEDFDPNIDLTAAGRAMLDQALGLHVIPEPGSTTLILASLLAIGIRRTRRS